MTDLTQYADSSIYKVGSSTKKRVLFTNPQESGVVLAAMPQYTLYEYQIQCAIITTGGIDDWPQIVFSIYSNVALPNIPESGLSWTEVGEGLYSSPLITDVSKVLQFIQTIDPYFDTSIQATDKRRYTCFGKWIKNSEAYEICEAQWYPEASTQKLLLLCYNKSLWPVYATSSLAELEFSFSDVYGTANCTIHARKLRG